MKIKIYKLRVVLIITLTNLLISSSLFAQAPNKMSYQAVIRNSTGNLVVNTTIGVKISIQKYVFGFPPTFPNVYIETHSVLTNENGLASFKIGEGTIVGGVFADIDWSDGQYYIKTETDPAGGTNYTISGTSQLLSVPYALYAKNAKTYKIGDFAHGGIVFWVDETGQHGLVCTKTDQSAGVRWNAGTATNTMSKGDGPKAGFLNTAIIIASQGNGDGNTYAARICNELIVTEGGKTYGDWYLPSKEELILMFQNRTAINATAAANSGNSFVNEVYWSSTEFDTAGAYFFTFFLGVYGYAIKNSTYYVRAIRAF